MVSYEEAYNASLEYFSGDDLAAKTFVDKYALRDNTGDIKEPTPDATHRRLAKEFARIEKKYENPMSEEEIYLLLKNFKYIVPQGSPMAGIGNPYQVVSISNCFVIESPLDSYGGILKADQEQIHIMKRRGGVGFDISNIRPRGIPTRNAAQTTDGIGVFMERFSNSCREVAQGGRRGALLLSISCHHPEIRTFIHIKEDLKKVTGANISIRISDEFMEAVKSNGKVNLRWPVEGATPTISEDVPARELWDEITAAAWKSAEPGLLFWDNALKYTPAQVYKDLGYNHTSTNPCGEIILSPKDSCRLLLLNLTGFVNDRFTKKAEFDFEKFFDITMKAQRLMDDIVDLELECIDKIIAKVKADPEPDNVKKVELDLWKGIKEACANGRRTGLGITGLGDCLAYLGIRYGSKQSVDKVSEIYKTLACASYRSSCIMAKERGAFPVFDAKLEKDHPFLERIWEADPETHKLYKKFGRRNIANTTTAPAGSMSILTKTTSGIEPVFLVHYKRRKKINPNDKSTAVDFVDALGDRWQEFDVYHPGAKLWMQETGETDLTKSPYHKASSADVDWEVSVDLQAAAQYWVCHSISKTCNVPNDTSVDIVKKIYMRAWEKGCKGFTVYRDGSRAGVLVAESSVDKHGRPSTVSRNHAPKRPSVLPCDIFHSVVQGVPWVVVVGLLKNEPYELFGGPADDIAIPKNVKSGFMKKSNVNKLKNRYDLMFSHRDTETVVGDIGNIFCDETHSTFTRMVSLSLRHGAPVQHLVEQLGKNEAEDLFSLSSVLRRALKKYIADGSLASGEVKACAQCNSTNLKYQEGCPLCLDCGYTKCK